MSKVSYDTACSELEIGPLFKKLFRVSSRSGQVLYSIPSNEDEALIECGWLAYLPQSSLLAGAKSQMG